MKKQMRMALFIILFVLVLSTLFTSSTRAAQITSDSSLFSLLEGVKIKEITMGTQPEKTQNEEKCRDFLLTLASSQILDANGKTVVVGEGETNSQLKKGLAVGRYNAVFTATTGSGKVYSASTTFTVNNVTDNINMTIEELTFGKIETNNKYDATATIILEADDGRHATCKVGVTYYLAFEDVKVTDWHYNAVKYVYENNIIKGYNNTVFAPNDKLTRGQLVTILYRMEGQPSNNGKTNFSDVKSTEWYAKAIKWAADNKIVRGYAGTNKFGPEDSILRQDLAGVLRNYANFKKKNVNVTTNLTKFTDYNKIDSYANASMQWAVGVGVITGSNNSLIPKGTATRAEAAAMLEKYCKKVGR